MTITYQGGTEQVRQIVHHHALLRRGLERRAGTVCDAVAGGVSCQRQVAILRDYLDEEILPMQRRRNAPSAGRRPRRPVQQAGPCAHPRAPQAGVPGRTASASRRRRRGRHHRGVDGCLVRRARDEGERPAASRPHRRGRGPWSPTRRHAHTASLRARVMPLHLEEEHIMYPSSALSSWQLAILAVVVVAVPAAWLTLVLLAARDRRRGSAATDAGGRDEETGATVTQLPSSDTPSGKAA
jgi:hypothetical protein